MVPKAELDTVDARGRAPLHCAVQKNYLDVVTSLLGAGAEVNIANSSGRTPLHIAICTGGGSRDLIQEKICWLSFWLEKWLEILF